MLKAKEWMDVNLFPAKDNFTKGNGVHGWWVYPKNYLDRDRNFTWKGNFMSLHCNNQTLIVDIIVIDGKGVSKYSYLQTYPHIPRGEPDENGYYRRSTDEEIIRYLSGYLKEIKSRVRSLKLKRILEI